MYTGERRQTNTKNKRPAAARPQGWPDGYAGENTGNVVGGGH